MTMLDFVFCLHQVTTLHDQEYVQRGVKDRYYKVHVNQTFVNGEDWQMDLGTS